MNLFGVLLDPVHEHEKRPERIARIICEASCQGEAHPCDKTSEGICKPEACLIWRNHLDTANKIIAELKDRP